MNLKSRFQNATVFCFPFFKGGTPTVCQKKNPPGAFSSPFYGDASASSSHTLNYCPRKTASSSVAWRTRENRKPQLTFRALRTFCSCDIPRSRAAHQHRFGKHGHPRGSPRSRYLRRGLREHRFAVLKGYICF